MGNMGYGIFSKLNYIKKKFKQKKSKQQKGPWCLLTALATQRIC